MKLLNASDDNRSNQGFAKLAPKAEGRIRNIN